MHSKSPTFVIVILYIEFHVHYSIRFHKNTRKTCGQQTKTEIKTELKSQSSCSFEFYPCVIALCGAFFWTSVRRCRHKVVYAVHNTHSNQKNYYYPLKRVKVNFKFYDNCLMSLAVVVAHLIRHSLEPNSVVKRFRGRRCRSNRITVSLPRTRYTCNVCMEMSGNMNSKCDRMNEWAERRCTCNWFTSFFEVCFLVDFN